MIRRRTVHQRGLGRILALVEIGVVVPERGNCLELGGHFEFDLAIRGISLVAPVVVAQGHEGALGIDVVVTERGTHNHASPIFQEVVVGLTLEVENRGRFQEPRAARE